MPPPPFLSEHDVVSIGTGLLDRSLPKCQWTHAGHFAAAIWVLDRRPELEAARDMPGIIRAYNLATGGENTDQAGYHETITQASLRAARAFLAAHPLHDICNALMASPLGNRDWPLTYWSPGCLFSVAARRSWVPPDIRALPF
jgi:hypothetical protein